MRLTEKYIDKAENALFHLYERHKIVLEKGEGVYLYDIEGKKYLDFGAGIAVFALGYSNKEFNNTIKNQIDKLTHTSNYFYNVPSIKAAEKLKSVSNMDKIFFTNSGTEAIEGAIKTALKYAYLKDGKNGHEIIALNNSFHGRTLGSLSVTGKKQYREPFEPLCGHIHFADMNDFSSIQKCLTDKVCAIILETVQGEGGIHPAEHDFLKKIRELCDEKDILLILDEIQCGMGRTGYMFAWQKYGIKPDIMTIAKAIGGGVPVGAFLVNQKVAENSLKSGDHGTTYGGNPLAGTAVNAVLDIFEKKEILKNVNEVGNYLTEQLDSLCCKYANVIKERRGFGLIQGFEFNIPVHDIIKNALDKGLILINAGPNIIRFLPPLIINCREVDEMIKILDSCIKNEIQTD